MNQKSEDPFTPINVWKSIEKMLVFANMSWSRIAEFLNATSTPNFSGKELWS